MEPKLKNEVWNKTGGKCYYCGFQTVPFAGQKNSFCVDHVIPQKRGGQDVIENLVPACSSCNSIKSSKGLFNWGNELKEKGDGLFYFELMKLPFPDTAWDDPL